MIRNYYGSMCKLVWFGYARRTDLPGRLAKKEGASILSWRSILTLCFQEKISHSRRFFIFRGPLLLLFASTCMVYPFFRGFRDGSVFQRSPCCVLTQRVVFYLGNRYGKEKTKYFICRTNLPAFNACALIFFWALRGGLNYYLLGLVR